MAIKIVHDRIRPDKLEVVLPAIREFVASIAQVEPQTRYDAYQAEDGVSFVHLMSFPDADAESSHQTAAHTARFVEILYPNCEQAPVFTDLRLLHSTAAH